jgi:hypothetical protein
MHLLLFFEGIKNESTNRFHVWVEAYPVSSGRTGFHELRSEELNALNHKGILIKCIKVIGEKRRI